MTPELNMAEPKLRGWDTVVIDEMCWFGYPEMAAWSYLLGGRVAKAREVIARVLAYHSNVRRRKRWRELARRRDRG